MCPTRRRSDGPYGSACQATRRPPGCAARPRCRRRQPAGSPKGASPWPGRRLSRGTWAEDRSRSRSMRSCRDGRTGRRSSLVRPEVHEDRNTRRGEARERLHAMGAAPVEQDEPARTEGNRAARGRHDVRVVRPSEQARVRAGVLRRGIEPSAADVVPLGPNVEDQTVSGRSSCCSMRLSSCRQECGGTHSPASGPNRTDRSLFTPPERSFFKPAPLLAPYKVLNYLDFNIRTKMAVVRLLRRKWPERGRKRPKVAPQARCRGSDNLPGMAAFRWLQVPIHTLKKNVPKGHLGGGRGAVVEPSLSYISKTYNNT